MFTGIIKALGHIEHVDRTRPDVRYSILTPWNMDTFDLGASISCNGCCLTVIEKKGKQFAVDVSQETLSKTSLSTWKEGMAINLEPSLKLGDEIGGHMVSGHVDGLAAIESIIPEGGSHRVKISVPVALASFIAPKGCVALDGISLTVNEVEENIFGVNIIPHTWQVTNFGQSRVGDKMNLEIDLLARYVARILGK